MDPLVIAGGVGELVDARLRHLHPVADRDLLADAGAERADVDVDLVHIRCSLRLSISPLCPSATSFSSSGAGSQ